MDNDSSGLQFINMNLTSDAGNINQILQVKSCLSMHNFPHTQMSAVISENIQILIIVELGLCIILFKYLI